MIQPCQNFVEELIWIGKLEEALRLSGQRSTFDRLKLLYGVRSCALPHLCVKC